MIFHLLKRLRSLCRALNQLPQTQRGGGNRRALNAERQQCVIDGAEQNRRGCQDRAFLPRL